MVSLTAALGIAAGAQARGMSMDADGDGRYSLAELRTQYPMLSALKFRLLDIDADGLVSPGEFRAGQDDGLLPIPVGG